MTKFQVARKVEGLSGHDIAINLEDHNGDGSSGKDIAGNELGGDVESHLLVGDCKEDAEGEDEDQGQSGAEEVSPEWHIRVVNHNCNRSKDEGNDENGTEPPVGNVTVARHEARVNIPLVLGAGAELLHNITSVPQVSVGDNCSDSGEAQAVVDCERRGEEDGGVVAVFLHVEETVGNDLDNVVWLAGVRIGLSGDDREVG